MAKQNPKKLTKKFVGKPLPQVDAVSTDATAVQPEIRQRKQIGNYKQIDSRKADLIRDFGLPFALGGLPGLAASAILPSNLKQLGSKLLGDARMSDESLSDEQKVMLWDVIQAAKKRTGKPDGGTEYSDYGTLGLGSSEQYNEWFNRGNIGLLEGISNSFTNPGFELGSTVGRGKYFTDPENPDKIYYTDVYDWNPGEKYFSGNKLYQKVRNTLRAGEDQHLNAQKNDNYRMNFTFDAKEIEKLRNKENGGWLDKYDDGGPVQPNYNDYSVSASEGFQGDGYSNVGRNYSPAWGGQFEDGGALPQFQPGGKTPIIVNDKNDPRLKAYQDSLFLYNSGKDYNRKVYNTTGNTITDKDLRLVKSVYPAGTSKKDILKYEKKNLRDEIIDEKLMKENEWTNDQIKTRRILNNLAKKSLSTGIMPTGYYSGEGYFPAFKKPTQPVIYQERTYQKETPELQPLPIQGMDANLPELQRIEGSSKWMRSFGAGANQNYWSKVDAYGMPLPGYTAPNQNAVVQPQGPGPEFQNGGEIAQTGKRVPFDEWYKTVPKAKNDTINYNLRRAYELAPQKELDAFVKDPRAHLMTAYENPETGIYEFMKSKHHSTINKELDWYNSKKGADFRNNYDLDTSGDFYRYVPKQFQMGGSMPGTVGFTYARVAGSAPKKGPDAKDNIKTPASAEDGDKVKTNIPVPIDEIKKANASAEAFNKQYVQSPNYINLLQKQGYSPDEIKRRQDQVLGMTNDDYTYTNFGPNYVYGDDSGKTKIQYNQQGLGDWANFGDIAAHEWGHVGVTRFGEDALKPTEQHMLISRLNMKNVSGDEEAAEHDMAPQENRADLVELRKALQDRGIYDSFKGGKFKQKHLNELRNYKGDKEEYWNRSMRLYKDKDIIKLMNTIAANNLQQGMPMAENGLEMRYFQEGLDFKPKTISRDGSQLVKLDQLTNFTNYNTKQPGGWLDKYND